MTNEEREKIRERSKLCGNYNPDSGKCKGLNDAALVDYQKQAFCGNVNCPFFKPASMGNPRSIVRHESGRKVWFERLEDGYDIL